MTYCAKCGHELGVGRYCTNCGHPVGMPIGPPVIEPIPEPEVQPETEVEPAWRTDTSERPQPPAPPADLPPAPEGPPPVAPPVAPPPPPAARFPLFADEVEDQPEDQVEEAGGDDQTALFDEAPAWTDVSEPDVASHRGPRRWGVWAGVAAVLTLVVIVGSVLLLTGGDDGTPDDQSTSTSEEPADEPSEDPSEEPADEEPAGGTASELAADATVVVPATANGGVDLEGNPVDYEAANMVDGEPTTTWRMPGDGTGREITITLPAESTLQSVGLINGYAKQVPGRDWYHGNRRVEQVEWVFDDGTTVDQDLVDTTEMQTVDVDVTTRTITLRLIDVSQPGNGPARRDFTAISELSLLGAG